MLLTLGLGDRIQFFQTQPLHSQHSGLQFWWRIIDRGRQVAQLTTEKKSLKLFELKLEIK